MYREEREDSSIPSRRKPAPPFPVRARRAGRSTLVVACCSRSAPSRKLAAPARGPNRETGLKGLTGLFLTSQSRQHCKASASTGYRIQDTGYNPSPRRGQASTSTLAHVLLGLASFALFLGVGLSSGNGFRQELRELLQQILVMSEELCNLSVDL